MIDFGQIISKETVIKERNDEIKSLIASRRYDEETKGITVNGMPINTERVSQSMITGAALSAMLDSNYTCKWKTSVGFIELNATEVLAVSQAMRAHVQACFDREGELSAAVDDGTYLSTMLNEGWPSA